MTPARRARYQTTMTAYKGVLSPAQIADVAAYVYGATHPAAKRLADRGRPQAEDRGALALHGSPDRRGASRPPGKITVQIVDPTGKAHPVQYGTTKRNITSRPFEGRFADFVVWPASARGVPLTFRVTVRSGATAKRIDYRVTAR